MEALFDPCHDDRVEATDETSMVERARHDPAVVVPIAPRIVGVLGCYREADLPTIGDRVVFRFDRPKQGRSGALSIANRVRDVETDPLAILVIAGRSALARAFGPSLGDTVHGSYHLTGEMRAVLLKLDEHRIAAVCRTAYRRGLLTELLCELATAIVRGGLIPSDRDYRLSLALTARIVRARQLIDERWGEKWTLMSLARAVGVNHSALTSGFRTLYDRSVMHVIVERRFSEARSLLLSTDLSIAAVGFECGYSNSASFTRAFGLRFGHSPQCFRDTGGQRDFGGEIR